MAERAQMAADLLAAAAQAYGEGDLQAVSTLGRAAFHAVPSAGACNLIGLAEFGQGDAEEAIVQLQRAATLEPANAEYPNNLGFVYHALGRYREARAALSAALAIDPGMANAANNLGSVLEKLGDDAGAIAHYRRALQADPAFVEARDNLMLACARVAPQWHFPMMADEPRNRSYANVLARVAASKRVLDIGSGSGLLAMIAAKAGAAHVATCEMEPTIAGVAQSAVIRNALADRIDVWPLKSDQLEVGRELAAPAEVLVTETFASGLLSEGVLPTVEDAHRRLLTPDAVVIPRRAAAMGYLVGDRILEDHLFAASWDGLDLSAFDLLAPVKLGMHLDRVPHAVLSADFEIFGFDLRNRAFPAERRAMRVQATAAGRCVGVAQWIRLDLDETVAYDNRPTETAGSNGWMHVIHRFAQPVDVSPGEVVSLALSHNRSNIAVGLDGAAARSDVPMRGSA